MLNPTAKAPVQIFLPGDTVQLNDLGSTNAKSRDRTGVIVSPSRLQGKFRVLWIGLKRPQIVRASLLRLAETQQTSEPNDYREDVVTRIDDELENIRSARFARHLGMPRQISFQTHVPRNARTPHRLRVLNYVLAGVIGLTAASIAIAVVVGLR